jgi:hypothetical protein
LIRAGGDRRSDEATRAYPNSAPEVCEAQKIFEHHANGRYTRATGFARGDIMCSQLGRIHTHELFLKRADCEFLTATAAQLHNWGGGGHPFWANRVYNLNLLKGRAAAIAKMLIADTREAYLEKVSERSRSDYERAMLLVTDLVTKKGDRVGDRKVKAITPVSADKIYEMVIAGPRGQRPRQGEKVVGLCARAWSVMHRLYPNIFNQDIPNPWRGVTKNRRTKAVKPAATRDQVYIFAKAAIQAGYPEAAAAAVICFEWLQRPENVLAGYIRWTDYRGREAPTAIRIFHHKTGAVVLHPLQDSDGTLFYADAEGVLATVPRRGIPMILHEARGKTEPGKAKPTKLYSGSGMAKLVRRLRKDAALPVTFTLDSCRHGGMTELEEAELTDGQGRALSAHKSGAYEGYAKRTMERAIAATRRRHAHRIAASSNAQGTEFRNEGQNEFRNDEAGSNSSVK